MGCESSPPLQGAGFRRAGMVGLEPTMPWVMPAEWLVLSFAKPMEERPTRVCSIRSPCWPHVVPIVYKALGRGDSLKHGRGRTRNSAADNNDSFATIIVVDAQIRQPGVSLGDVTDRVVEGARKLAGRQYKANEPRHQEVPHAGHRDAIRGDRLPGSPTGDIVIPDREGSETRDRNLGSIFGQRGRGSTGADGGDSV